MSTLTAVGAGILGFVILDGLWLGVVMASFYQRQFQGIGRFGPGGPAPARTRRANGHRL